MPTFDLVADFGGDLGLWNDYTATATGTVTLNVPTGTFQASNSQKSRLCFSGETVIIQGEGIGSTELRVGGVSGGGAMPPNGSDTTNNPNPQPLIDSVDAGSSSVQLKDASDYSKFIVGHYALLSGLETQYTGYPQNWQFFEWIKVASASPTGVITFETPIQNSYRDYWPYNPSFNQFASDLGGPASLYPLLNTAYQGVMAVRNDGIQTWALDLTVRDCTIRGHGGGSNVWFGGCRKLTFENCSFPGYPVPVGGTMEWVARNCLINSVIKIEIDKIIGSIEFDSCNFVGSSQGMSAQSGSVHSLWIHDCTGTINVNGTTGDTVIENCPLNALQIGTSFYGHCKSLTIDNCTARTVEGTMEGASSSLVDIANITLSDGVLSMTRNTFEDNALYMPARCCPGTVHVLKRNSRPYRFGSMRMADMREQPLGGGNIYIRTDIDEDKWNFAGFDGTSRHPCTDITVTNSSGTVSGIGMLSVLSRYPAPNMPFGSYYHTGEWNGVGLNSTGYADKTQLWGKFVSCTVNIIEPYTGVLPSCKVNPPGGLFGATVMLDDFTTVTWNPHIDTKTVGTRVFTPGSTTGATGADSNMTALPSNATWISAITGEEFGSMLSTGGGPANISGEDPSLWPLLTVELVLDQEIGSFLALDALPRVWPAVLPQDFLVSTFGDTFANNLITDEYKVGPPQHRRRSTAGPRPFGGNMAMTTAEWEEFRSFFELTLKDGALRFEFPPQGVSNPDEEVWTCRFKQPPSRRSTYGDDLWDVSLALERLGVIRNPVIIPALYQNTNTFYAPSVAITGDQAVTAGRHNNSNLFYAPTVAATFAHISVSFAEVGAEGDVDDAFLLESGDSMLLESGDDILLE